MRNAFMMLCLILAGSLIAGCSVADMLPDREHGSGVWREELSVEDTESAAEETHRTAVIQTIPTERETEPFSEDVTITIGLPYNMRIDDYDTDPFTLAVEAASGCDIEFVLFQSSSVDHCAQLSTMLAVGDELPDIIWNFGLKQDACSEYGRDGYFVNLSSYYNDELEAGAIRGAIGRLPESTQNSIMDRVTERDGAVYVIPAPGIEGDAVACITGDCDYPLAAWRVLMAIYSVSENMSSWECR